MYSTKLRNLVSPEFLKDNHRSIFTTLLVFFLFPLCFISQYNFPSSDDFDIFLQAQKLGTIEATKYWYFNWTGRYSSFFLQSFLAANTDWLLAYKVIPMLLFIFEFGILFYFLKSFFGWCASDKVLFSFTACLFIFLISVTPDITTGFYWLPSGFQYVGAVFNITDISFAERDK